MVAVVRLDGRETHLTQPRHQGLNISFDADGVRERRDAAGVANPLHPFGEGGLVAVDVALRRFVQVFVEGLAQVRHVALFDQQLREVGPPGHAASARFGLCERDVHPQLLEARDQANVTVAAGGLQIADPGTEFAQSIGVEEIAEQMHGLAMQLGGELDATDQIEPGRARHGQREIEAGEGIVVGYAKRGHARADCLGDELGGRESPVRFIGVRVEVDQRRLNLNAPV